MFKGVHVHEASQKLRAMIKSDIVNIHIGLFLNEIDAARAYNEKATKVFGAFADLNTL